MKNLKETQSQILFLEFHFNRSALFWAYKERYTYRDDTNTRSSLKM